MSDTPDPSPAPDRALPPAEDAPTIPVSKPPASIPRNDAPDLPLPEELTALLPGGMYRVEGFLGQGGMGAVYKGVQVRLKRPVAIKIMRRDQGQDYGFEQRFEREAQAMAKLNHPGIVSVIDYGEAGEDYLYIVMELVDGADMMDVIRGGQMTQEMALTLLPQICDALQFAHDHGIVHRDIKPSNIMLTRDGRIKMADFGLAKPMDGMESSFRTQTGTGMGTPDYAAPEQFDPHGQIDHRADIYALGVMIYQMITGQLPRGVWKPPSQRAEIAPQWDDIVAHAMQNDPADRYQSASEVKTDVSSIPMAESRRSRQTAEVAGPTASQPRALASTPTKPRAPSLATRLVILAVLGVVAFFALRDDTRRGHQTATAPPTKTDPASRSLVSAPTPAAATKDAPFVNTLGMKFVPVSITGGPTDGKRVLFSVWETRVQDYEVFVKETKREWKKMDDVDQGSAHAVAGVSWNDARAFCLWLTERERRAGRLGTYEVYRLPGDHEWSCAVGIGDKEDAAKLPSEKSQKLLNVFPWGSQWPPVANSGNYWSEELRPILQASDKFRSIKGELSSYRDQHATVGPVGFYSANLLGLYDLGGNVWEWCEDWFDPSQRGRVLRGASWDFNSREGLLSSCRIRDEPDYHLYYGFRCVLSTALSPSPSLPVSSSPASATKDAPFVNTLGMKFVPVPITGGPTDGQRVLFSVWETRVQDYNSFPQAEGRGWKYPGSKEALHPASNLSWEDAAQFCVWLTEYDRSKGKIGADVGYRLPSDHEWSCVVGIGQKEDATVMPARKSEQIKVYAWGDAPYPPEGHGNYGLYSGCKGTSPVDAFSPQQSGLHDLTGNVWEWCADRMDEHQAEHVLRGGSWRNEAGKGLYSSLRIRIPQDKGVEDTGFRCVLAPVAK